MISLVSKGTIRSAVASLALLSGAACAQLAPVPGLMTFRLAQVVAPDHDMAGASGSLSSLRTARQDSRWEDDSIETSALRAGAAFGYPADDLPGRQDRSWGIAIGVDYGALSLRGTHQDRRVTAIRPFDQPGANIEGKNAMAAANYKMGWGTAYAAYSASRGWGASPLYNPDNPYSVSIAGTASGDSRDMLAGVAVPLTRSTTLLASYIHKNDRQLSNRDANQLAIGTAYTVSRCTDFYAAYSHSKIISASFADIGRRSSNGAINIGMRHAF